MDDTTVESPFEKVWLTENPLEAHVCERIDEPAHNTMF